MVCEGTHQHRSACVGQPGSRQRYQPRKSRAERADHQRLSSKGPLKQRRNEGRFRPNHVFDQRAALGKFAYELNKRHNSQRPSDARNPAQRAQPPHLRTLTLQVVDNGPTPFPSELSHECLQHVLCGLRVWVVCQRQDVAEGIPASDGNYCARPLARMYHTGSFNAPSNCRTTPLPRFFSSATTCAYLPPSSPLKHPGISGGASQAISSSTGNVCCCHSGPRSCA